METFETPGPVVLAIQIPVGNVDLVTWDDPRTQVDFTVSGDDELARELTAGTRIEMRERAGGQEIIVDVPRLRGGFFRRDPDLDLRIRCPHGTGVDLRTRSADVTGRGRFGGVDVTSVSGDVEFDELERGASVKTTSGDLYLGRVAHGVDVTTTSGDVEINRVGGAATIRLVSGDLRIREADGSVIATSVSGDQSIEAISAGDVRLQSVSGDVVVGIRRGSRLFVDAKSISGDTTSELDLGDEPGGEEEGPLVELRANTVSGDIRVVRALAPAV
jgi:hypothetical protein